MVLMLDSWPSTILNHSFHPLRSWPSPFRKEQIYLMDFDVFCISLLSAFLSPFVSCRIPPSVTPVTLYLAKFPSSFASPALWLCLWSRRSPIVSLVLANWSPSLLGFQPLPWETANLSSALLPPHPCQFWLISQTENVLIAAAGFPWSACQGECNREERGMKSFLSFAA